ncbi:MAG: hypothetical protein MHM6MM_002681 [Cercozoa sp. M6MM]
MSFVPENASALHDVLLNRLPGFAESRVLAVTGAYFKKLSERGEWTPSEEEATVIRRRDERRVLSCMVACGVVLLGTFPLLHRSGSRSTWRRQQQQQSQQGGNGDGWFGKTTPADPWGST